MVDSERLSEIKALGKLEIYHTKNQQHKPKYKKGQNSVKILQMTSQFERDLYFIMLYPSVNVE